jgi:hypothetical protein
MHYKTQHDSFFDSSETQDKARGMTQMSHLSSKYGPWVQTPLLLEERQREREEGREEGREEEKKEGRGREERERERKGGKERRKRGKEEARESKEKQGRKERMKERKERKEGKIKKKKKDRISFMFNCNSFPQCFLIWVWRVKCY